jgi:DNA transformation protein
MSESTQALTDTAKGRKTPRNLGAVSMTWLETVGVHTLDDIEELGVVEVFLRVQDAGFVPSRNLLWSLQGAVLDLPWAEIPPAMKAQLEREVALARNSGRKVFVPELPEVAFEF